MYVLLADRLCSLYAIKCMVMHELTYFSQYLLFKSLAYAQSMPAASLIVDNWLANWQSLIIKCKSDILILTSQRTHKYVTRTGMH